MNITIKNIFIGFLSFLLLSLITVLGILWNFSNNIPDYKFLKNYKPPVSSKVYSGNGSLVADFSKEKRIFVPYRAIPKNVINSFLSAEDKNFFSHPGVDAKGVLRATINNIQNIMTSKRLEGASTITQQVAKNFLLTNEVSINRKIKEAILAFRIERALTKERILELYLNQIYLGSGAYGVAAASLQYFDKSIKELNYEEAALLAALPKAPSKYNPYRNIELAKFRRNLVLKNLNQNGFLSDKDYKKFKNSEIILKRRKIEILNEANSYTEEVRRIIKDKYGFEKLYTQGLSITSPLDINYQIKAIKALRTGIENYDKRHGWRGPIGNILENPNLKENLKNFEVDKTLNWNISEIKSIESNFFIAKNELEKNIKVFRKDFDWVLKKKEIDQIFKIGDLIYLKKIGNNWTLKQYPRVNGGLIALDPFTGEVKALVGGYSYISSEFNRVTQAKRQPGSAFKPFVYAAALENGLAPNSIVLDAPFIAEQGIGLKDWKPENYGKKFYGPSTLRKGIEYSRNLMTVRVAKNLGLNKILNLSKELEIYEDIPELLSVSLGSVETSLINLTAAYATFVNGGKKINPTLINRIQDRRGKTIFLPKFAECVGCDRYLDTNNQENLPKIKFNNKQVISEQTAYQVTSILKGAVIRGTGKKLKDLKVPLAGKTGTTNNNFDAWFIGFSSNLVIGVYVGFDSPKTLGKYETGSKAALPIFKDFVKETLFRDDFNEFLIPDDIYFAPINYNTGKQTDFDDKNFILEAFKKKDINNLNNNQLISNFNYDKLIKFRQFY